MIGDITPEQLYAQYERANRDWPFIHRINDSRGLPPYTMFAIGSRETNLRNIWGDYRDGRYNGAGVWQRDIQHGVPDGWMENVEWQCEWAADHLVGKIEQCNGDFIGGCNAYNSGSCRTTATTGQNYGPDVAERRQYLLNKYGKLEEEFVAMASLVNTLSGYAVDVKGASKDDRATLQQYRCKGTTNQSISFEDAGNGYTRIKFAHSGKYLDNDPARLEAVQFSKADVDGQLWIITTLRHGALKIESKADGRVLDVEGISKDEGARIIMWPWNAGANQQWVVVNFR